MPQRSLFRVANPTTTWLTILALLASFSAPAFAHPGRTDSSGCHTCRTNCASWGLEEGQYHCHNGDGGGGGGSETDEGEGDNNVLVWVVVGAGAAALLLWYLHEREKDYGVDLAAPPGLDATCESEGRSHSLFDHLKEHTVVSADPNSGTMTLKLRYAF